MSDLSVSLGISEDDIPQETEKQTESEREPIAKPRKTDVFVNKRSPETSEYDYAVVIDKVVYQYRMETDDYAVVAVSISSTIEEIHNKRPELTAKELFKSGIHVGKDMMGTMSNTLILAFTGGAINTMILIYAYIMPYLQVVNMYSIGIEVIKGISGTLGIVLTVPIVSVISAKVYSGGFRMYK